MTARAPSSQNRHTLCTSPMAGRPVPTIEPQPVPLPDVSRAPSGAGPDHESYRIWR